MGDISKEYLQAYLQDYATKKQLKELASELKSTKESLQNQIFNLPIYRTMDSLLRQISGMETIINLLKKQHPNFENNFVTLQCDDGISSIKFLNVFGNEVLIDSEKMFLYIADKDLSDDNRKLIKDACDEWVGNSVEYKDGIFDEDGTLIAKYIDISENFVLRPNSLDIGRQTYVNVPLDDITNYIVYINIIADLNSGYKNYCYVR